MTARRRAILIVVLAVLLLGVMIAAVLLLRRAVAKPPAPAPVAQAPAPAPPPQTAAARIQNPLVPTQAEAPVGRTAAAQMAELFAERYGSYSNQGDYQNLRDLLPIMTDSYRKQTEAYLASAQTQPSQAFEGVTSVKVSTSVRSYGETDGTAVIAVTLQQEQTSGLRKSSGYRTLRMDLKRVGQDWRVDDARWENDLTPAT